MLVASLMRLSWPDEVEAKTNPFAWSIATPVVYPGLASITGPRRASALLGSTLKSIAISRGLELRGSLLVGTYARLVLQSIAMKLDEVESDAAGLKVAVGVGVGVGLGVRVGVGVGLGVRVGV